MERLPPEDLFSTHDVKDGEEDIMIAYAVCTFPSLKDLAVIGKDGWEKIKFWYSF